MDSWQTNKIRYEERLVELKERDLAIDERREKLSAKKRAEATKRTGEMSVSAMILGALAATCGTFGFYWFTGLFAVAAAIVLIRGIMYYLDE